MGRIRDAWNALTGRQPVVVDKTPKGAMVLIGDGRTIRPVLVKVPNRDEWHAYGPESMSPFSDLQVTTTEPLVDGAVLKVALMKDTIGWYTFAPLPADLVERNVQHHADTLAVAV